MANYSDKLKDPRWQKKRLLVLEDNGWTCGICHDTESTLHVHHRLYWKDCDPWDYPDQIYAVLCDQCHEAEHKNYKNNLDQLVECIKSKFFSPDIAVLTRAFCELEIGYDSIVVASSIHHLFADERRFEKINREYIASVMRQK